MSRSIDLGLSERRLWLRLDQPHLLQRATPFTFPQVLSYVVLGALFVAVLMIW